MTITIDVEALTSFETNEGGASICMRMQDTNGCPVALSLPIGCLNALLMTLPRMVEKAVQRLHKDTSMRIVYPASDLALELGDDLESRLLTIGTPDGFRVCFKLTEDQCREIGGGEAPLPVATIQQRQLN